MKKLIQVFVVSVLMTAGVSFADECTSVRGAKKLLELNRQGDAIACLENLKTDVEANYLLGVIYFQNGNRSAAAQRFSAPAVRSAYGSEIFQLYKSLGDTFVSQANFNEAGNIYVEAVSYKESARQSIANEMFEKGKTSANIRGYFNVAKQLDASLASKTADHWNSLSQKAKGDEAQNDMLREAAKDDPARFQKAYYDDSEKKGRRALEKAKVYAKKVGMEAPTAEEKALAKKYLGNVIVEQELPVEKIYQPGTYTFSLKSGEQTESWITFPSGVISNWNLDSPDGKFQAIYDDGEVVNLWSATKLPRDKYKFKLRAVTDQPAITMAVSQR